MGKRPRLWASICVYRIGIGVLLLQAHCTGPRGHGERRRKWMPEHSPRLYHPWENNASVMQPVSPSMAGSNMHGEFKKNTTQYDFRAACQPNQVLSSAEWQETDIGNWNGGCPHTSDGNDETITQQEARQAYKGIRALGIGTVPPCNAQMLAEAQLAAEFLYVPKPQTVVHHSAHIVLSTQMDGLEYNKKIRRWFRGWKLGKE